MHKKHNWGKNKRGGRGGRGFKNNYNNNRNWKGGKQIKHHVQPEQLAEPEVGISEYLSDLKGFSAIIKARYSDFHVSEIDLNRDVAKITETKIPDAFLCSKAPEIPKESPIDGIKEDKWEEILKMLESKEEIKVTLDVDGYTKEERAKLHKEIKSVFREKIICETLQKEDKKIIELRKYSKGAENRSNNIFEWPKDIPECVHFLLYKESLDTMEAIIQISNLLHLPSSAFNYAGVKDRRAKTTQWISIHKIQPYKLLIKTKSLRNIRIGNLNFKTHPLKLGQLWGNQFKIALRNVEVDDEVINESMESLKRTGFINYYGLQRFGNDREVPTYEIGIKLMQGKWKEAVNLILKPKKCEDSTSDIYLAKKHYQETGNAKEALKKLSRGLNMSIEAKLLNGLANSGVNEYVNALESIPRNTRLLYIHAFQSLVWNQLVSERLKLGMEPIVGDLVLVGEEAAVENDLNEEEDEDKDAYRKSMKVKVLCEGDLVEYSIYDVVLPLPGYDIVYPENSIKDKYVEVLGRYDLELKMQKQKVKTYTLSGNYRKILERPSDLSWKTLRYNDPNDTLIRSDFEEMLGHKEPEDFKDGKYKGFLLFFKLPSSSYATMVLREVLKTDTSSQSQTKLNNYHLPSSKKQSEQNESQVQGENSLLSDKDKFEAFKRAIFESDDSVKELAPTAPKKPKIDGENEETGIKTQASLV